MPSWTLPLVGGVAIGVSASLAWSGAGRIAGISGIFGGFLRQPSVRGFRPGFLFGLLLTGALLSGLVPRLSVASIEARPLAWILVSGLLVGFGTQLGSGCTSGHGVCGVSRLSKRSLLATAVFMSSAALVVFVMRHAWAGAAP